MARAPSHGLAHGDLTDLEGPTVVGCPLEPLESLVHRAHLPQPISSHELLGLRPWPVDDNALFTLESKALALRARERRPAPITTPALTNSSLNFWCAAIASGVGGVAV